MAASVILPTLSKSINLLFHEGKYPNEVAKSKVLPLHKNESKNDEKQLLSNCNTECFE